MSKQNNAIPLHKDEKLDNVLARQKDEFEDCTPCRLMGSAAFTGLGVYTFYSGRKQLRAREREIIMSGSRFGVVARTWGLGGLSAALVGIGMYRLFS